MIRDSGTTVEFWINSGNTSTFDDALPWAYIVNGVTSSWQSFRYNANAGWQKLGSWSVTTNQTVTFKLDSTGTSGFGGPTTFAHAITRATVPSPPGQPVLSNITLDTITVSWTPPANGGSTITGYTLGYGTDSSAATVQTPAASPFVVINLMMNTLYYFWVRATNAVGSGGWSKPASATTYLGVYVNVAGIWIPAFPYVRTGGVWKLAKPFAVTSTILEGGAPPEGGGPIEA